MREVPRVALAALFITALVSAQLLAVKVLALPLPVALPVVGATLVAPAGVVAYALTFFATDCYAELYGRRDATVLVNVGFAMTLVLLGLLWLAIRLPGSDAGVDPAAFAGVLAPSTNIVAGSLLAYLVSQNLDVVTFDALRIRTEGQHLWLRNLASTGTSQLIDTVLFIGVAFWAVPQLLGLGAALPTVVLLQLVIGQYLLKLGLAALDTPLVYLVVRYVHGLDPATRTQSRTF
ncbi:MAG: queuosine precursor transporter [Halobacteriales archaeon]|nr:queuosine precursor transporter [Halobacteriales archaeon]